MTVLICPVREGENNDELRYALRSWEANLLMPDLTLMVVGYCPQWLRPDHFIHGNNHDNVNASIFENVRMGAWAAMDSHTEEVIYMNDDFFCLDPTRGIVPVRRNMTLQQHIDMYPQYRGMWWVRSLDLTASWLAEQGFPHPWSYEVHRPLVCKPVDMWSALGKWGGDLEGDIPQWRTLYGVLKSIEAHPVEDVKLGSPNCTMHSAWVSTSDNSWRRHGGWISKRFQKPSRWEK